MSARAALLALTAAACASVSASTGAPPLREQIWTQTTPELAHVLTHAPGECLAAPADPEQRTSVEVGRALFRSPALLGGPAARTGLSCNSCHVNGRGNAHFFLPELTDRPGAADVTSEWSSKVRGDGVMNPRDIPDLAGVRLRPALGRLHDPSLTHFVDSAIVEEFQGVRPPQQAFDGVIAYLRALDLDACPADEAPITLRNSVGDVYRALAAARHADEPTMRLVLLATQDAVGRIVERLPTQRFAGERRDLELLSRDLGAARNARDVDAALDSIGPGWQARFDAAIARVAPREAQTYFNEATVRRELAPSSGRIGRSRSGNARIRASPAK